MNVEHFISDKSFVDLVQKIKKFVEPRGNKIKFVDLKFQEFIVTTYVFHAVLIYNEVSDRIGGLT